MNIVPLTSAVWLSLVTASASFSAPVDFNFSFTDGTNTVMGLIEGLESEGLG
jgi:hypothetical protein